MKNRGQDYVIDPKGKKKAVIIPVKNYEQRIEDLHDLAIVAERRDEKSLALTELTRRLKNNGLL
jgi:PHD/YefM family antitoxin component YafN of YafNO toxin-antitoxin module